MKLYKTWKQIPFKRTVLVFFLKFILQDVVNEEENPHFWRGGAELSDNG